MTRLVDLDAIRFVDAVVILDIDGTLMPSSGFDVEEPVRLFVDELKRKAIVYLFSNRPDTARNIRIAESLGLPLISTKYKKPNPWVLSSIVGHGKPQFVIGDKVLTDGLLALFTGSTFVHVRRTTHAEDTFFDKTLCVIDDVAARVISVVALATPFVQLMRPQHWIKNVLMFAPLFFAGSIFDAPRVLDAVVAFVAFCCVASAVYVLNDLIDVASDREHPVKKHRPIASGRVNAPGAWMLCVVAGSLGIALSAFVPAIAPWLVVYGLLNIAYSLYLKHVPFIEVIVVATFYVLRIIVGGEAASVPVSAWIVLCTFFGALVLVSGKRLAEHSHSSRRRVLQRYSKSMLRALLTFSSVATFLAYVVWCVWAAPVPFAVYSSVFVGLALWRVSWVITGEHSDAERPEILVFKDSFVLGLFVAWGVCMTFLFYAV
jgi:decaprenyl-phosphate phosphoribosyltransferase